MSLKVNQNIAFRGNETVQPQQNNAATNPVETQNKVQNIQDKEKSNAMKYAIGATALAAVITLGILGRKGKLGKGIQKFLGGTPKAAQDAKPTTTAPAIQAKDIKLKDGKVVSLEYKDGLIQTAKKIDDECYTVSSKSYKYDKDGNLIQIKNFDNIIFKKKSIGNTTRIDTKYGFCIFEDNTLKYRHVKHQTFSDFYPKNDKGYTYAYDKNGKVVGTIIDYDMGTRYVNRYIYVTPDGTKFTYLLAPKHESCEAIKVLKSYVISNNKSGRFCKLNKEKSLYDGNWSEPEYYYEYRSPENHYKRSYGVFEKDGRCIEKDDDMTSEEAEKMLTDIGKIGKRIKDAHKKVLKIIYDVEENTKLFCQ